MFHQKIFRFLAISILIHGAIFGVLTQRKFWSHAKVTQATPTVFKIHLTDVNPSFKISTQKNFSRQSDARSAGHRKIKESSNQSLRYGKLLPELGHLAFSNHSIDEGVEPAASGLQLDAGSHIDVKSFLEDLSARIEIPDGIYQIQKSGATKVHLIKGEDEVWRAELRQGDRYTRAIVQRAIAEIPENSIGLENLKNVNYRHLEIDITFNTRPTTVIDKQPRQLILRGNHATIAFYHFEDSDEWKVAQSLIAPASQTALGLNIIGLALLAKDSFSSKPDPLNNPDLVRLRNSPAFTNQIFSVPLK